jgi:hypothetical protein
MTTDMHLSFIINGQLQNGGLQHRLSDAIRRSIAHHEISSTVAIGVEAFRVCGGLGNLTLARVGETALAGQTINDAVVINVGNFCRWVQRPCVLVEPGI